MTAPTRDRPDVATLDEHIATALVVLRRARSASSRSRNSESLRDEVDAEGT
jgi:hypothetical protein